MKATRRSCYLFKQIVSYLSPSKLLLCIEIKMCIRFYSYWYGKCAHNQVTRLWFSFVVWIPLQIFLSFYPSFFRTQSKSFFWRKEEGIPLYASEQLLLFVQQMICKYLLHSNRAEQLLHFDAGTLSEEECWCVIKGEGISPRFVLFSNVFRFRIVGSLENSSDTAAAVEESPKLTPSTENRRKRNQERRDISQALNFDESHLNKNGAAASSMKTACTQTWVESSECVWLLLYGITKDLWQFYISSIIKSNIGVLYRLYAEVIWSFLRWQKCGILAQNVLNLLAFQTFITRLD